MRSLSRILPPLAATLLLAGSNPSAATPSRETSSAQVPVQTGVATPADPGAAPATPEGALRYGPIQAKDPEDRSRIKQLYRDQADLETAGQIRLGELAAALAGETDAGVRLRIQQDMIAAKKDLQLRSMELGLEISFLNEDIRRIDEFQQALDRLRNPEKYMPATLDPSIARERARQLGLEQ
jgi:hypothetical protein